MSDHSELKKVAEAALQSGIESGERWPQDDDWFEPDLISAEMDYVKVASPAAVLALIAEVGRLEDETATLEFVRHTCKMNETAIRDSGHETIDGLAQERDKLKAEVARSTEREIMQLAEIEALRKDAERYRFISQLAWYVDQAAHIYDIGNAKSPWVSERSPVDADDVEAAIDAAMGGGSKP